jgi:uncharacterized protein
MRPLTFKTNNNNYYLYSPAKYKFIPIPLSTYEALSSNDVTLDHIAKILSENGYLVEDKPKLDGFVEAEDVYSALANLPQIVFEVTTSCNLRCKYCCYGECYETFANREFGRSLDFNVAKLFLDYFSAITKTKYNTTTNSPLVISFYGGEPLLNISLIKRIVAYAKNLNFKGRFLKFSLTTNATLLAKNIDFLVENDFAILVSLDGDKETNAYRVFHNGHESFDEVCRNLKEVAIKHPTYFKSIRFNSVYTNLSDTTQIFNFFSETFNRIPTLAPLHFNDSGKPSPILEKMHKKISTASKIWYDKYPYSFLEIPIHKKIVQVLMYLTDSLYYNEISFTDGKGAMKFPTHTCLPFSKRLFISVDGFINPCEKVNRDTPLGFINDKTVQIDTNQIASYFNKIVKSYKHTCETCAIERMCNHCAMTAHSLKCCPEYCKDEDLENSLSEIFTYIENNPSVVENILTNIVLK